MTKLILLMILALIPACGSEVTRIQGIDGAQGIQGVAGEDGTDGKNGKDGAKGGNCSVCSAPNGEITITCPNTSTTFCPSQKCKKK